MRIGPHRFSGWLFHRISVRHPPPPSDDGADLERLFESDLDSHDRFFRRFDASLVLEGKSVLDVGCGTGAGCVELARRGASRVVGVDIQELDWPREKVARDYPALASRIELRATDGSLSELGSERFDVVLSKDSFEHYADPESFVGIVERFVAPGGILAIGFGPLWKSPTGGHIEYMVRLPWAHLLFPEAVIMRERKRFRPNEDASSFAEVKGGLNKMTLTRFRSIMGSSGLECLYFATNVSDHPAVRAMKFLSRLPVVGELFTVSAYSVWRKPAEPAPQS